MHRLLPGPEASPAPPRVGGSSEARSNVRRDARGTSGARLSNDGLAEGRCRWRWLRRWRWRWVWQWGARPAAPFEQAAVKLIEQAAVKLEPAAVKLEPGTQPGTRPGTRPGTGREWAGTGSTISPGRPTISPGRSRREAHDDHTGGATGAAGGEPAHAS